MTPLLILLACAARLRYNSCLSMVLIEIPANPNCAAVELRAFHDLEPAHPVSQVRLERQPGSLQWFDVTSWSLTGTTSPARLQKVDDSGEGVAFLLYGEDAGLRLKPADPHAPWRLDDPQQWGEPFIILTDLDDVRLQQPTVMEPRRSGHG